VPIRASRFTEEQIGFALNQAETGTSVFSVLRNRSETLRRACACRVKPCKCWCCWGSLYRWLGRFTKVSIDWGASEPAYDSFSLGSSAETQRIKELGLVKPYLSQDPRLITLSCRHLVTNFCRAGSHSAREENFPREVNSSGPITGPCSILTATRGLLTIFSSAAIRYHVCACAAVAKSIATPIVASTRFDSPLQCQTLESGVVMFAMCEPRFHHHIADSYEHRDKVLGR
jgi:hypothetical protein